MGELFLARALVINPSFLRMQESRELHTAMDSRIRGNDGDGFVTKAKIHVFETRVTIRALAPKGRNITAQAPGLLEQKRSSFRRKNRSNINNFRHPRWHLFIGVI
jgi:hypothetical protein